MIEIKNKSGELILSVNPGKDSVRKCELMKEDYNGRIKKRRKSRRKQK